MNQLSKTRWINLNKANKANVSPQADGDYHFIKTLHPQVTLTTLPQFINRNFINGAPLLLEDKFTRRSNPISPRFMTREPPAITRGIFSWRAPPFRELWDSQGNCKVGNHVVSKLSNCTYHYMNYCRVPRNTKWNKQIFLWEFCLIHVDITTLILYLMNYFEETYKICSHFRHRYP